jgi:ribosomal protein S3
MGQKVHPLGFRVGITQKHYVRWFADPGQYPQYVLEDFFLRQWITKKLPSENLPKKNEDNYEDTRLVHIFISRFLHNTIKIKIYAVNPESFSTIYSSFAVNDQSSLDKNKKTIGSSALGTAKSSSFSSTVKNSNNLNSKNFSAKNKSFSNLKKTDGKTGMFLDNVLDTKVFSSSSKKYLDILKKNSQEKVELGLFLKNKMGNLGAQYLNLPAKTKTALVHKKDALRLDPIPPVNQTDKGDKRADIPAYMGSPGSGSRFAQKVQLCLKSLQEIKDLRIQIILIRRYLNKIMLGQKLVVKHKLYKKYFILTKVLENKILKQQNNLWLQFPNLLINYFKKTKNVHLHKAHKSDSLIKKNKSRVLFKQNLFITKQEMEQEATLYVLNELQKSMKKISSHESPFNLKGKSGRIPAAFVALKSKRQSLNRFLSRFGYFNSLQKKGFAFLKSNLDFISTLRLRHLRNGQKVDLQTKTQKSPDLTLDIGNIDSFKTSLLKLEHLIKTPKQNLFKLTALKKFSNNHFKFSIFKKNFINQYAALFNIQASTLNRGTHFVGLGFIRQIRGVNFGSPRFTFAGKIKELRVGTFKKKKREDLGKQKTFDHSASSVFLGQGLASTRYLKKLNKTIFHSKLCFSRQNLENIYNSTNIFEICHKMSKIQTFPKVTSLELIKVKAPIHYAACIANFVVEKLEKRFSFRGAMKKAKEAAMKKPTIKGIKIKISGRLNGAEIARTEWIREGPVPLQTLKANIDYSSKTAKTIYGILGIKVWIFKKAV